jgi:membrane-bound lytic murein transglycosylase F
MKARAALPALCLFGLFCSSPPSQDPAQPEYVETGDLAALRSRGVLRILMPPRQPRALSRRGFGVDTEVERAEELAAYLGLIPEVITIGDRSKLLQALLEGRGDLIIARLTATRERRKRFEFSVPIDYVGEVLVTHRDDTRVLTLEDLDGLRVTVRPSSSFHETLERIREEVPGLQILPAEEEADTEELLYRVANGDLEATVADDDMVEEVNSYLRTLRAALPLTGQRPVAWAIRPGSPELKAAVDAFLHEEALEWGRRFDVVGDLDAIRKRRVLRVLTRNNAATYFLYRGRQMGFEYELAREFARRIGCRLQIVVPPGADQLVPWLLDGRGDVIAAAWTVTESRARRVAFSRPYKHVSELVVVRRDDESILGIEDLEGRKVAVRPSSSYHSTLLALQGVVDVEILEVPEETETELIVGLVGDGDYDVTIADSDILDIEFTYRDTVRAAFALGEPKAQAWAVRPDDRMLLAEIDRFLAETYRGEFFNVLTDKYFKNERRVARVVQSRPTRQGRISPYDDLFRKYGRETEIDWRLLVAQAYQESRFDPEAVSWAGAAGIMQIMPRTAGELGVTGDLSDPETGIRAGSTYLRRLMDQFEPSLRFSERLRFALASYNAGRGHIQDGRRIARELGLDPDVWFDNVETALPLLGRGKYAAEARYGYCRCLQPLQYVRQINERYAAYVLVADGHTPEDSI